MGAGYFKEIEGAEDFDIGYPMNVAGRKPKNVVFQAWTGEFD